MILQTKTNKILKKEPSISKLIKELDKVFSIYIRNREIDKNGMATCFTCGKKDQSKNLQCGHYWSRVHKSLRWDEVNCQVQCVACNIFKEGNKPAFTIALEKKYGKDIIANLELRKNNRSQIGRFELIYLIDKYKKLIKK